MASFTGIPVQAFEFYDALAADNTKTFWTAHKGDYDAYVKAPMEALITDLCRAGYGRAQVLIGQ